jgi:hypothetical protein
MNHPLIEALTVPCQSLDPTTTTTTMFGHQNTTPAPYFGTPMLTACVVYRYQLITSVYCWLTTKPQISLMSNPGPNELGHSQQSYDRIGLKSMLNDTTANDCCHYVPLKWNCLPSDNRFQHFPSHSDWKSQTTCACIEQALGAPT